jgi:hypothetical protein
MISLGTVLLSKYDIPLRKFRTNTIEVFYEDFFSEMSFAHINNLNRLAMRSSTWLNDGTVANNGQLMSSVTKT